MDLRTRQTCTLLLVASALVATLPVFGATETRHIVVPERETGQLTALDVVHGYAASGDMLLGPVDNVLRDGFSWPQPLAARSAVLANKQNIESKQYLIQGARSWPLPIAYVIDETFPLANVSAITDALAHFASHSGIRFVAATTESNYLRFLPESSGIECGHSFFGMQGGDQPIYINLDPSCDPAGTAVHEIMHALGFGHEHQRADRDSFVQLHLDCVMPETMATFQSQVVQTYQSVPYGPYDYASIMHYSEFGAFSTTCPVITPIPTDFFDSSSGQFWGLDAQPYPDLTPCFNGIGQTCGLSKGDVLALDYFYGGAPLAGAVNYQGLWWAAPAESESGWGINVAHQGDTIFATWFTYDQNGKGLWLAMTAQNTGPGAYAGTLYTTTGPAFNSVPFNPAKVVATAVGMGTLTFTDANNGTFAYTVNGIAQNKAITRQVFGTLPSCDVASGSLTTASNYTDLWWASPAGSESGWGINLTQEGTTIFATWFTYDLDGTPMWLVATAPQIMRGLFQGTLYRTTGPAFNAVPFNPMNVATTAVGMVSFTFSDGNNAMFHYTVNGVDQAKAITREVFVNPGTVCL